MASKIIKKVNKVIPSAIFALTMLVSCATPLGKNTKNEANAKNNIQRVNFDEVLKNVKIGFEEKFNDSVLVSSAVNNYKVLNQEVTVIVEMDGNTTVDNFVHSDFDSFPDFYESNQSKIYENNIVNKQIDLATSLLKNGLVDDVYGNYSTLMNGFYAKTTYGRVDQIRGLEGVKNAYVSTRYAKPSGVVSNNTNIDSETGIYKNETNYDGKKTIVAILDSGFDFSHEVFNIMVKNPAKTKADIENKLKDTVAYQMAKGELTINDVYLSSKVPFAYDYAEKKADVYPIESDHGTHVSGIIGGQSSVIKGIAPQTQFAWMKVFSDDDGGGDSSDIICALEDAVKLGVDAINLSLGSLSGYSLEVIPQGEVNSLEERTNKVYKSIEDAGVSLLSAAGNEYSSGYQSINGTNAPTNPESGTISSPGSYSASLTVASINGTLDAYALANGSTDRSIFFKNPYDSKSIEHIFIEEMLKKIKDLNITPNSEGSYELDYVTIPGYGLKTNYSSVNVKGKIALVKRGNISFEEKLKYAYQAGAIGVLIYNNVSGTLRITVGQEVMIPISLISMTDGVELAKKRTGKLTFNETFKAGPFMSDFSSWGPLADLVLKPEITAHGGNIKSAILGGGYDLMSGTSMATPNTCGIVLVIRDYVKDKLKITNPKEVTQMVNRLIMSTATICLNEVGNPYSPRKQGAGLASLVNSTTAESFLYVDKIDKSKLELGDDKQKTGKYVATFNIKNITDKEQTYDISNSTLTETVAKIDEIVAVAETPYVLNPKMDVQVGSNLTLNGTKVTVPANTDSTITVTLNLTNEDKKYLDDNFANGMFVEGFIKLNNIDEKAVDLSIPFLSFYGDWLAAPMFDKTYYEVDADRANGSISEKDKIKADMIASTPYGKYAEYYMIPLGTYIYEIPEGYEKIAASIDKAAITNNEEDGVYNLYTVFLGMLRGAKKLTMTIEDATTSKVLYSKVTYNNRKATYVGSYGGILGYNEDYSFSMFNEETQKYFANNTKMNVKFVAELDYKDGDKVANNVFEFSFYVDYEVPTLHGINYVTEYDKSTKKDRYYMELDVFDNRYVQSIRPCVIKDGTLVTLSDDPIPVYQNNPAESTRVKIEVTNYLNDIKNSDYPDTMFYLINDYALNSNIYLASLAGCDYKDLKFNQETIEVNKNEVIDLNKYVNFENACLQGMKWTTSNDEIAIVDNAQVIGLRKGLADITGTSTNVSITATIKVLDNKTTLKSELENVEFTTYNTIFCFDDDLSYSDLKIYEDKDGNRKDIPSFIPTDNNFDLYPTESFKLEYSITPWYFDANRVAVEWSSSNDEYVSVTDEGVVTAKKETVTPIKIKGQVYVDGKESIFSTTTTVSVKNPFVIQGVMLQYYKGPGGVVELPKDKGIQYIGEYAFSHYKYKGFDEKGYANRVPLGDNTSTPITKIIFNDEVEVIQGYAFMNLKGLKEVVLADKTTDIYPSAFEGCESLTTINLNKVEKIQNRAFAGCKSLVSINKEGATEGNDLSNVITVGSHCFDGTALTKLDLKQLRMAGVDAFANNNSLTAVKLYEKNPLNINIFANNKIESLVIPHSLIKKQSFDSSSSLKEVTFTAKDVVIEAYAFNNSTELTTIKFSENCESVTIGYRAFANTGITTLNLPNGKVTLDNEAFYGNSKLKEVKLAENTDLTLKGTPFIECPVFDTITSTNTTTYVVDNNAALLNKEKDTLILVPNAVNYTIPATVKTISEGAYAGNNKITSIDINAETVRDFAFAYCSNLTTVNFVNTNTTYGTHTFFKSSKLATANMDNLKTIYQYMFAYTGLTNVALNSATSIQYGAFANIATLQNVTINSAEVEIEPYAFYASFDENTNKLSINNTKAIGEYAFADSNLKEITFTNKVDSLPVGIFMNCKLLTKIEFTNGVVSIDKSAFENAEALTSITLDNVASINNNAFKNNKALTTVTITSSSFEVGANAFNGCVLLNSIDLSNATKIGNSAFYGCEALETIDLSNVADLGVAAFANCYNLTTVNNLEKSSITVIKAQTFYSEPVEGKSSSLKVINLSKIVEVKEEAFYGCVSLNIADLSNIVKVGDYAFYNTIINIVDLNNATDIGNYAFNNASVKSLSIPKVVNIGSYAFAETLVGKVDLPTSLKTIGEGAFINNYYIEEFTSNKNSNYTNVIEGKNIWKISDGVLYTYLNDKDLLLAAYPLKNSRTSYTVLDNTTKIGEYSFYLPSYTDGILTEISFPISLKIIGANAFAGYKTIKTYTFTSYNAPTLESIFAGGLRDYIYSLQAAQLTNELDNLYNIQKGPIYNMYFYMYPYYYSNFSDFIGFVNDLTIQYPSNGVGYTNMIYNNYFKTKVTTNAVADIQTQQVISMLEEIRPITDVDETNKDKIAEVYFALDAITDPEQIKLINENDISHANELYNQVIEINYPSLSKEEITTLNGIYTLTENISYELNITNNGSGTFKVVNKDYESQNKDLTFDIVRKGINKQYAIITSDGSTFEFDTSEDKIIMKYYALDIELQKQANSNGSKNNTLLIVLLSTLIPITVIGAGVTTFIIIKKRKSKGVKENEQE